MTDSISVTNKQSVYIGRFIKLYQVKVRKWL